MVSSGEVVVMTRMSSLSLAKHWHGLVVQRHMCSHEGIVFYERFPRWVLAFTRNVHFVEEWERNGLCICHTTLLCMVCLDVIEGGVHAHGE